MSAIRKAGNADNVVRLATEYADNAEDVLRAISAYGDEAVEIITKYGDEAIEMFKDGKSLDEIREMLKNVSNIVTSAKEYADKVSKNIKVNGNYVDSMTPSQILRSELYAAGIPNPPYKNAAHHIVPWNDPRALDARNILDDFGIEYNSAANGVFLPMEINEYVGDIAIHVGNHSAD